jgi:hypothetical protein
VIGATVEEVDKIRAAASVVGVFGLARLATSDPGND